MAIYNEHNGGTLAAISARVLACDNIDRLQLILVADGSQTLSRDVLCFCDGWASLFEDEPSLQINKTALLARRCRQIFNLIDCPHQSNARHISPLGCQSLCTGKLLKPTPFWFTRVLQDDTLSFFDFLLSSFSFSSPHLPPISIHFLLLPFGFRILNWTRSLATLFVVLVDANYNLSKVLCLTRNWSYSSNI